MEQLKDFCLAIAESVFDSGWEYCQYTIPAFVFFWIIFKQPFANRRIQLKQRTNFKVISSEIKNSIISMFVFTLVDMALYSSFQDGKTLIYFDISNYGWGYLVLSIFLLLVFDDTYFYWTHRLIHHPRIFPHVHKIHHQSFDPSPFAAYSFHPLEAVILGLGGYIVAYIIPVHFTALLVWQFLNFVFNVIGHLGYEIYPKWFTKFLFTRWKTTSTHHNMHHEKLRGNYALYFTWWDKLMGTEFKDYEAKFIEIHQRKILKLQPRSKNYFKVQKRNSFY
jgi:sterol desaturase/sphingolipid hydroxylase (fatty acid hydroxylase superfamily)